MTRFDGRITRSTANNSSSEQTVSRVAEIVMVTFRLFPSGLQVTVLRRRLEDRILHHLGCCEYWIRLTPVAPHAHGTAQLFARQH